MLSISVDLGLPTVPRLVTPLPGPKAKAIIERDRLFTKRMGLKPRPLRQAQCIASRTAF